MGHATPNARVSAAAADCHASRRRLHAFVRLPPPVSVFRTGSPLCPRCPLADLRAITQPIAETPRQARFHQRAPFGYMPQNAHKLKGDENRHRKAYHDANPAAMKRMSRD